MDTVKFLFFVRGIEDVDVRNRLMLQFIALVEDEFPTVEIEAQWFSVFLYEKDKEMGDVGVGDE